MLPAKLRPMMGRSPTALAAGTSRTAGGLYHAGSDGRAEQLLDLAQDSADIGILPAQKIVLVPMMMDNVLVAYQVE